MQAISAGGCQLYFHSIPFRKSGRCGPELDMHFASSLIPNHEALVGVGIRTMCLMLIAAVPYRFLTVNSLPGILSSLENRPPAELEHQWTNS